MRRSIWATSPPSYKSVMSTRISASAGAPGLAVTQRLVDVRPPPEWLPKSSSTGSERWSDKSTTDVSKTTIRVFTAGSEAKTAPKTPA